MHQLLRTIAEDDDSAFYSGASKAVQHVDHKWSYINGEQRAVKHGGEQRRRYERLLDTLLGPISFEAALGHWWRVRRFCWWRAAFGAETTWQSDTQQKKGLYAHVRLSPQHLSSWNSHCIFRVFCPCDMTTVESLSGGRFFFFADESIERSDREIDFASCSGFQSL